MIRNKIILGLMALLVLWGCEDKTYDPVVSLDGAPALTSPADGASFTLLEEEADNLFAAIEWTSANFGYPAGISYTVQLDEDGNDFASPITLGTVNGDNVLDGLTVGRINNILLARGLPFGFDNPLELRVCAEVADGVAAQCSNVVDITISPYQTVVEYPLLTVPGDYQGWDPANEATAIYSRKSDDVYSGFLYFNQENAFYKFAQGLSWDTNWGDNGEDGILDPGGADIALTGGPEMFHITVDLNDLSFTTERTSWGLIGDATPGGWDSDQDMVWDADRGVLTITLDLNVGEIKFRANDAWDLNFGDNFTNGTLELEGANIPIESAGNYTIDLILDVADYTYTVTKN
jgi:hypothetical protein